MSICGDGLHVLEKLQLEHLGIIKTIQPLPHGWDVENTGTDTFCRWPYTITISDGEPVTLTNVLIGEVWLCSGQSNMEMPVKGFRGQRWRAHVMLLQQLSHPIIFV